MDATNLFSDADRPMSKSVHFLEIMSGSMRPRHRRFKRALEHLFSKIDRPYDFRVSCNQQRLITQLLTFWNGVRARNYDEPGAVALLHQTLNYGNMPYMAEFDVPLALHGYRIGIHRRASDRARALAERPQLRALLTFSDWAGRSFDLHYGPVVGAKCRTVYPLAYEHAYCKPYDQRAHDFSFISTSFRIKSGPEVVRAFCRARIANGSAACLCVVTNLEEAYATLGNLDQYKGVEWQEANLDERAVADLLADTRCLLHPTLSDSFGVVVLEALAGGCAIITSQMASFPEMVSSENGWILPVPTCTVVGDTYITEYGSASYHNSYLKTLSLHRFEADLEESMSKFLQDPQQAASMMATSYALYESKFSICAWEQRMLKVLAEGFPELEIQLA